MPAAPSDARLRHALATLRRHVARTPEGRAALEVALAQVEAWGRFVSDTNDAAQARVEALERRLAEATAGVVQ